MNETDVALTDFMLGLEALLFFLIWLFKKRSWSTRRPHLLFYSGLGLAAILGGIVHGFFPDKSDPTRVTLWWLTLNCSGIAGLGLGYFALPQFTFKVNAHRVLLGLFGIYIVLVSLVPNFGITIGWYLPLSAAALAALVRDYQRTRQTATMTAVCGLLLSLLAAIPQQMKITVHPIYLTHNSLYHLLVMIAVALFFYGTRNYQLLNGQEISNGF